jgi:hypothetical protein
MRFHIVGTQEVLISHSGLVLAGALLQATELKRRLDRITLDGHGKPAVSHGDNVLAMIGLLCMGKSDFEAINAFEAESDAFFRLALGLGRVPSEPTLRQRLDLLGVHDVAAIPAAASRVRTVLLEESAEMIRRHAPKLTACFQDWIPLDVDVSPFDNSHTRKQGVGWTYKKVDGYAPIFGYLGQEGYLINCQLRPGTQHCQCGTPEFLDATLRLTRRITPARLLVRLDAGNDDVANVRVLRRKCHGPVDWIIKRNLRKESLEEWFEEACAHGVSVEGRPGKEVWVGDTWRQRDGKVERVVVEAIRRTTTADGQALLVPELEIHAFWTSLKPSHVTAQQVVALYHDHGTSEQFHSELKTDMDIERLPSGKFATNARVLECGLVAYNALRLCGQESLRQDPKLPPEQRMPVRKRVRRRRLRSVIQDMVYLACRLVRHARRWSLAFWKKNPWRPVWERVYARFLTGGRRGLIPVPLITTPSPG